MVKENRTVRVRLLVSRVEDFCAQMPGDFVLVAPADAERMLRDGQCEVVRDANPAKETRTNGQRP